MAIAPEQTGIGISRHFTEPGTNPYDTVTWERRDARISNFRDGTVAFEQTDVEFPSTWSLNATNIVAQKYFRGPLGTPQRESSVRHMIGRVVDTITGWGRADGYFATDADATVFADELTHVLVTQKAAFNSPVWFNVGAEEKSQCSACFILAVEDTMSSIDLRRHREIIAEAHLILTMTEQQKEMLGAYEEAQGRDIFTLKEFVGESGDIHDPFEQGEDKYRYCRDEIKRCLAKGVDRLLARLED